MSNQEKMDAIASQFGERDKVCIFLGREKIYPAKEVSNATVERLENALRSPESEKGTLRVLEETIVSKKAELIYRSSQGALDFDPKNIAPQFQATSLSQVPETIQVEQSQAVEQTIEKERSQSEEVLDNSASKNKINNAIQFPVNPAKDTFSFPINPTQAEFDETMEKIFNSIQPTSFAFLHLLDNANTRIDILQKQLEDTRKTLQEVSKIVCDNNLKSWAEHKGRDTFKISQSIAEQAKNKIMQWMQSKTTQVKEVVNEKVNEVKSVAQEKINEAKTIAQDKGNEVKTFAQLKAIEFKEVIREQANNFLAPINSKQLEQAAKHIIQAYGDGKSYDKAVTHSFHLSDKNELSIARQSDGAIVYERGELTKAASSHDILKLNTLPTYVDRIKATQMQFSQKAQMEAGS